MQRGPSHRAPPSPASPRSRALVRAAPRAPLPRRRSTPPSLPRRVAALASPAPPSPPPPPSAGEAGSVTSWWAALSASAGRRFPVVAQAPEAPKHGQAESVRWSLYKADPSLNQSLISEGTTISELFDQDKWERHRRVARYWRHVTLGSLLSSTVFRRLAWPIGLLTLFSAVVCCVNSWCFPLTLALVPFSLTSPVTGLLLVFRLNNSYSRFAEGRELWGAAVRHARDAARLVTAYAPRSAARSALLAHLVAWAWLLKASLRAGRTRDDPNDPTRYADDPAPQVIDALGEDAARPLLAARNRPYAAMLRITAILRSMRAVLPDLVMRRVEDTLVTMGASVGGCERILSTPLPLSYTRFTGRALVVWLASLPLALWPLMHWQLVPAVFFISYLCLGIDEIGVEIEEPFSILPLHALCQAIKRDVAIADECSDELQATWPGGMAGDPVAG